MRYAIAIFLLIIAISLTACGSSPGTDANTGQDKELQKDNTKTASENNPADSAKSNVALEPANPELSDDAKEMEDLLDSNDIDEDIGTWEEFEINPDDYLI